MAEPDRTAAELIPDDADLDRLRDIAAGCEACRLHETGTQTVFGEGPSDADVMFVGEQPGDEEDQEGEPFVGPAGRELDRALGAVGIDRDRVYITNVVKHFKWSERKGKRRLHEKPSRVEIESCLPWLEAEIDRVQPRVVVALGATAAQSLIARDFRVTKQRGELHRGPSGAMLTGVPHPSSILRSPSDDERHEAREDFHDDLRRVAALINDGVDAALRLETKTELYELAKELDLRGRSSMTKDDLVQALAGRLAA
ncbi:MAG: UdgX family uracil-DNA binding protein [Nitriliruptorales bacterium]|nr:UdgX family uracil-DNA binding protein [Nitriliruptorales bacterium]